MKYEIDVKQIYSEQELETEIQNLVYNLNNKDSKMQECFIVIQSLQLYFMLCDRLGIDISEKIKVNFEKMKTAMQESYTGLTHKRTMFYRGYSIVEQYIKTTYYSYMQNEIYFGTIEDKEITLANYVKLLQDQKEETREVVYRKFYSALKCIQVHLQELFNLHLEMCSIKCRYEGYRNVIDRFCITNHLQMDIFEQYFIMYDKNIHIIHEYYAWKASNLGIKKLGIEHVMAPVFPSTGSKITIEDAYRIIISALSPLGTEYINCVKTIFQEGRIDIYDRKKKYKGAYTVCSFCKGPYSSVNFEEDSINDLFALIHEIGHNVQYQISLKNNSLTTYKIPYLETEVSSLVNEFLLYEYLQKIALKNERNFYIFKELEDFEGAFFRQSRFLKFEYIAHKEKEKQTLLECYQKLLKEYYGDVVMLNKLSPLECLRTPQLYEIFYVMNYCIGVMVALQIVKRLTKDNMYSECYRDYLSANNKLSIYKRFEILGLEFDIPFLYMEAVGYFSNKLDLLR